MPPPQLRLTSTYFLPACLPVPACLLLALNLLTRASCPAEKPAPQPATSGLQVLAPLHAGRPDGQPPGGYPAPGPALSGADLLPCISAGSGFLPAIKHELTPQLHSHVEAPVLPGQEHRLDAYRGGADCDFCGASAGGWPGGWGRPTVVTLRDFLIKIKFLQNTFTFHSTSIFHGHFDYY